jgi:hypothetical protein
VRRPPVPNHGTLRSVVLGMLLPTRRAYLYLLKRELSLDRAGSDRTPDCYHQNTKFFEQIDKLLQLTMATVPAANVRTAATAASLIRGHPRRASHCFNVGSAWVAKILASLRRANAPEPNPDREHKCAAKDDLGDGVEELAAHKSIADVGDRN